jgi:glycerate kinase
VAALSGLPDLLNTADVIVTGEGRFDSQSLHGKVVGHILGTAPLATAAYVVCGSRGSGVPETSNALDIVELAELAGSTRAAIKDPGRWLQAAGFQIATGAVPHDSDNQYRSVGQ